MRGTVKAFGPSFRAGARRPLIPSRPSQTPIDSSLKTLLVTSSVCPTLFAEARLFFPGSFGHILGIGSRSTPSLKHKRFTYDFNIGDNDYYEVHHDSQSTATFRVDPIPVEQLPRIVRRNFMAIPDCRYVDDGINW